MSHDDFIDFVKRNIYDNCYDHRIIPSVLIAHAAISSDWGNSELAVKANNLFNTRYSPDYGIMCYKTKEPVQGSTGKQYESTDVYYRVFRSWRDSIMDYIARIEMKESYMNVGTKRTLEENVQVYADAVTKDKSSSFSTKILKIICEYQLDNTDKIKKNRNPYVLAQVGDKGEMVKWIQYELSIIGYKSSSCFADGYFDYRLMVAVQRFQKDNNIEQTGFVDLKTFKLLAANRIG